MSAMQWLISAGATVSLPFGHSPHYDLVADFYGCLVRVQVKTSRCFVNDRWQTMLCTRGGNQSWGGQVKRLDPRTYDYLLVCVADGRRWFIPARRLGARSGIRLGGPKYELYEVEPGEPMPTTTPNLAASRIA
jgi:PD-(D/E)XK nuclease superfamily protein